MSSVMIVGPGKMGLALGHALLQEEAVRELTVCGRRPEPPAHPIFTQGMARYVFGLEAPSAGTRAVFLAVPEGAVPEVAHALGAQGPAPEGAAAFHLSGWMGTGVLEPLHAAGYAVGAFHPLQVVAHPVTAAQRLPGSYIAVTGSPAAFSVARNLADAMGARTLEVPETWKTKYHAATVMAADMIPALLDAACRILERAGVPHEDALPALLPLVSGVLANISESGIERALAGPIPDADLETISLHLRALDDDDRRLYATIGREVARLSASEHSNTSLHALIERFDAELGALT